MYRNIVALVVVVIVGVTYAQAQNSVESYYSFSDAQPQTDTFGFKSELGKKFSRIQLKSKQTVDFSRLGSRFTYEKYTVNGEIIKKFNDDFDYYVEGSWASSRFRGIAAEYQAGGGLTYHRSGNVDLEINLGPYYEYEDRIGEEINRFPSVFTSLDVSYTWRELVEVGQYIEGDFGLDEAKNYDTEYETYLKIKFKYKIYMKTSVLVNSKGSQVGKFKSTTVLFKHTVGVSF